MATIDYTALRRTIYRLGEGKEDLKSLVGGVPSKQALIDGFQAIEDKWVADRLAYKANIDAAMGVTTSNDLAKFMGKAWLAWKAKTGNL